MAKSANAGELRTPVYFFRVERVTGAAGVDVETEVNVFGVGAFAYGKWVNAHGSEVYEAHRLDIQEPATFTTRYSPAYAPQLVARLTPRGAPYEVISVDNVENRGMWCEIKLRRKETAR